MTPIPHTSGALWTITGYCALLLLLLLLATQPQPADSTLFLAGGVCALGLDAVLAAASGQLDGDIGSALQTIDNFCHTAVDWSIEMQVYRRVAPLVLELSTLAATGQLDLDASPNGGDYDYDAPQPQPNLNAAPTPNAGSRGRSLIARVANVIDSVTGRGGSGSVGGGGNGGSGGSARGGRSGGRAGARV